MAFQSIGTVKNTAVLFNTGYLTVNGKYLGDVTDLSLSQSKEEKDYWALNSRKMRALRSSHFKQSLKATIKGNASELYGLFYGSSSPVAGGNEYSMNDGEQSNLTAYVTQYANDTATKRYQYQIQNATFFANNVKQAEGDYATVEVDIVGTDILLDVDTATES